ncbi:MAG: serine hydrolase [Saprospiraceae bacterium]|nr:MAG: serine hydrolase [Saprospiraceae bacterium]
MKIVITLCTVFLTLTACQGPKQNSTQTISKVSKSAVEVTIADVDANRLNQAIQPYLDEKRLSGVVAMVAHEGKLIYTSEQGYADVQKLVPMQQNTLFRLASLTKPITSVATMILVDRGKLALDDQVSKYLPSFAKLKVYVDESTLEPLETPVTIRHLLMHTSGLGSGFLGNTPVDLMIRAHDFSKADASLEAFIDELATFPLVHQPGASFTYGFSTDVLARIIEVISGQSIEAFMKANIFDPLKMEDTFFSIPEAKKSRLGPAYTATGENLKEVVPAGHNPAKYGRGNSGLIATAPDYLRFAQMLLNGGTLEGVKILSAKTVELMHTDQLPKSIFPISIMGTPILNNGFGLGFAVVDGNPAEWQPSSEYSVSTMGNLPATSFYWLGAYNDSFWIDPTHDLIGVVMTQSIDVGKIAVFQDFYQALYKGIYGDGNKATFRTQEGSIRK